MKKNKPLLSVIIPTYNSEETLGLCLKALREQTLDQDQVEILVIDGGSIDKTKEIAKEYNSIIIENPKRLPIYAFELGFIHAKGSYIFKIGSDEVHLNENSLQQKIELFENNKELNCIGTNKNISPKFDKKHFSRSYLNHFGEPFTAFVYKKRDTEIETFKKRIIKKESNGSCIIKVEENKPYPILDGATLLSLDYVRENFSKEMNNLDYITQIAEHCVIKSGVVGFIEHDAVLHIAKASFGGYLKKIKFRIVNNVFNQKISGYSIVAKRVPQLNRRKYLFALYCLSIILPIIHSIYYAVRHKDITLLAHFIYAEYTFIIIVYCLFRKLINLPMENKSYG